RHDIDAKLRHQMKNMSVVGGQKGLLRDRSVEPSAGLQKEFMNLDVGRELASPHCCRIDWLHIVPEMPCKYWIEEAALKIRVSAGTSDGQCSDDLERQRSIVPHDFVESV